MICSVTNKKLSNFISLLYILRLYLVMFLSLFTTMFFYRVLDLYHFTKPRIQEGYLKYVVLWVLNACMHIYRLSVY